MRIGGIDPYKIQHLQGNQNGGGAPARNIADPKDIQIFGGSSPTERTSNSFSTSMPQSPSIGDISFANKTEPVKETTPISRPEPTSANPFENTANPVEVNPTSTPEQLNPFAPPSQDMSAQSSNPFGAGLDPKKLKPEELQ